ncbi:MAG: serine hydrolase [Phycisphaerales bacterium]|nr:serine hydrolase [Phycisphaerales bacterium]
MHAQLLTLTAAVLFVSPVSAQEQQPLDRDAIVEKHLQPLIDAVLIPGAVVGLYKDDELSFHTVGTLNYDTDQAPSTNTIYEIGSIGKVFTGVFFADAIRRGEVTKHTKLQELVPEGIEVIKGAEGTEIELWHLTTHSSGWGTIPVNLMPSDPDQPFTGYTEEMLYAAHESMPLNREPGTGFEYSNFGVGTLGTVLARNAGGEYEALVKQRIFKPLGLTSISIELSDAQLARLAPPTNGGLTVKRWGDSNPIAPAGLWSATAPELITFAMENLRETNEDSLEIYESLTNARETMFDTGYGKVAFGWMLAMDGSTYWHNGQTGGYSSYMGINHVFDTAVVVLANGATHATTNAGAKLLQELIGMNPEPMQLEAPDRLDDAYLERILGVYRSEWGFDITFTSAHNLLYARVTNQNAYRVDKVGDDRFGYSAVPAELQFAFDEEGGVASSVTLFQNGAETKCVRVDE